MGFDTSRACVDYGTNEFGLHLRCEYFSRFNESAISTNATLITCIMVMEHLSTPRVLAEEIAGFCLDQGAKAFVSVPFFNDKRHLYFESASTGYNVFNDVGAHVTYFSDVGLVSMFEDFGLKKLAGINSAGWRGFMFGPLT